ncbi:MAG TPA: NAD(P)/FAD-dependent oxidoreductase [Nocardioides sp.]|uniref:flavin monoamine oxidase family protein n=1 Tax=uncultured Nocardioides sp. TaxID=198441 RepID=UPI000EDFD298|nr:NAD(P)/FAD-dependent oxidoreductase [uncultured Nocardioides sp.]HCB03257.1 amine oxidase [Nocardioides sp.]HRI93996.1 NAD(P)/FAD-dependent oxidoreductase [Nocardioides sp.]HRK44010.1 NAD(P)/FAD-dependent oxidoreductase [Nocardioides sp.]
MVDSVEIAVVGAGFAGLRVARDLSVDGRSVVLLEAAERVGGRAFSRESITDPGTTVEVGGAYFHRHHHARLAAEVDRYNIDTQPAAPFKVFRNRLALGEHNAAFPIPPEEFLEAERILYRLIRDAHRIDPHAGLENQNLQDLDISANDYLNALDPPPVTSQLLRSWIWNMMGQRVEDASALWVLQLIASHDYSVLGVLLSLDEVMTSGTGTLTTAMANEVADLRLGEAVHALHQQAGWVDLTYGADRSLRAKHVVVATPLNCMRELRFEPPLSGPRADVVAEGHGGRGLKLLIHVQGVPEGISCTGDGVLPTLYDYLPASDGGRILVGFTDRDSFDPADNDAIEAAVHHYLPEAVVVGTDYHDWCADPYVRAPWVSPRIGQVTRAHKSLGEPHGRVHFAGSDVSLLFPGYIEGALETADRVRTEVAS